jgi:hypothetical protein
MSDLSDKNIDNIFKSGSEGHDFDYNPEAWKEMEQLLDKEERRRGLWWWWFGLGGLFILLTGLYLFNNSNTENTLENLSGYDVNELPALKKEFKKDDLINNSTKEYNQPLTGSTNIGSFTKDQSEKPSENSDVSNFSSDKKSPGSALEKGLPEMKDTDKISIGATKKDKKEDVLSALADSIKNLANSKFPSFGPSPNNIPGYLPKLPLMLFPWEFPIPDATVVEENRDSILIVEEREEENPSRFLPGLVFASEVSAVGDIHLDYLDWKFGLELQYRFGKYFSASVGANYIKKNYNAAYIDYDVPDGFWVRDISPSYTKGHCSILEIPIQLGYYPNGSNASGFQIQAGLSSYLMLKERYYYYYVEADPDLLRYWHSNNVAKHWMGILQLAPGYQIKTDDGFFRVAPYAQIPLQGVGIGKIKLNSFGLQFNYNFLLKK